MPVATKAILIVDDDRAFAEFLDEALTSIGYATHIAKHGAAAFVALEEHQSALILVDVFMPVIDGITFCRMVRANPATRNLPIIAMSATADVGQTFPVAIAGFLVKPFEISTLLAMVAGLIGEPTSSVAS
jgi:CheY-like chemotaxis protein